LPKSVQDETSCPFIDRAVHDRYWAIQTAAGKFADDYVSTLQRHLASAGAGKFGEAYGFGEAARHAGISIRQLAALHHDALLDLLLQPGAQDAARRITTAKEFFMEALSPFEKPSGEATAGAWPLHEVLEEEARRIAHALHDDVCVHMDRAREAESSVFLALRTKDWLSPEDLMARAVVAADTARAWCDRFWQMGLVVRRRAYPDYRYRGLRVPLNDAGRAYLRSIAEQNRSASLRMDSDHGLAGLDISAMLVPSVRTLERVAANPVPGGRG